MLDFFRDLEKRDRFRRMKMPRSRRRHHSRSRSKSRSHSHDRDREAKRRKIEAVDSPSHKRSVSSEPQSPQTEEIPNEMAHNSVEEKIEKPIKQIEQKLNITPTKALSPKQLQKRIESEKKRQQKQLEREEREKKKQEEKERIRLEKEQQKKEKEELKNKRIEEKAKEREIKEEQKRKEKEEKEAKRKEREEKEEAKRKEREQEKLRKQQEIEEKNREKQKLEEQKQKAAQAFVNFFVPKKSDTKGEEVKIEEGKTKMFMPFEVKSDMRLAPVRRPHLSEEEKSSLIKTINESESSYLKDIKGKGRKCGKTWPYEEDVIIDEDFGDSICEDKQKLQKMRVKFLKFHENRRPAYYGTWRKKSVVVNPRRPFGEDKSFFDYEVDSDDDWEEEEQGESLNGSDDEEKETEGDNDDYEVDNEFFVPHGHLSDDEVDDEQTSKLSPESHKQKLKLLKDEFDQDMQTKTNRMKPRSIGCIWYNKDQSNVDEAIDRHLRPLAMITNGVIIINKRKDLISITPNRKNIKELQQELIPSFLKLIQGNVNKKKTIIEEFINYMKKNGHVVEVSKAYLTRLLKQNAQWKKSDNKYCWCLDDEIKKKYNVE